MSLVLRQTVNNGVTYLPKVVSCAAVAVASLSHPSTFLLSVLCLVFVLMLVKVVVVVVVVSGCSNRHRQAPLDTELS